jgi:hypothetical protein
MDQLASQELLFNVREEQITTMSGIAIPNKKAIINNDTGNVISTVGQGYKTVSNEEIFSSFCKSIESSGVDATGCDINVDQTDTGARAMVTFTFPEVSMKVNADSSETVLQLCALNSFDGSTRYVAKAGGLRMKCLNGQILGSIVSSYSSYHTKSLDVDSSAQSIINMVEDFNEARDYWGGMMQQLVSTDHARQVLAKFLYLDDYQDENNKRLQMCMDLWRQYSSEMGGNAYALYNVMTDYVTTNSKSAAGKMRERNHVAKLLDTEAAFHYARECAA